MVEVLREPPVPVGERLRLPALQRTLRGEPVHLQADEVRAVVLQVLDVLLGVPAASQPHHAAHPWQGGDAFGIAHRTGIILQRKERRRILAGEGRQVEFKSPRGLLQAQHQLRIAPPGRRDLAEGHHQFKIRPVERPLVRRRRARIAPPTLDRIVIVERQLDASGRTRIAHHVLAAAPHVRLQHALREVGEVDRPRRVRADVGHARRHVDEQPVALDPHVLPRPLSRLDASYRYS